MIRTIACLLRRTALLSALVAVLGLGALTAATAGARPVAAPAAARPTVVLVHGAAADASSWHDVILRLQRSGYPTIAFANPLRSVASDSAYLAGLLASIKGPIVLVGHSYGGIVISIAAAGNPQVKSLVYVDAFLPEVGETLGALSARFPGSKFAGALMSVPFTLPDGTAGVDLYFDPAKYRRYFTGPAVSAADARALAAAQRPIAQSTLTEPATAAAWKTIRSWDVIGTRDQLIVPPLQRFMARRAKARVTTLPAAHASMLAFPGQVTNVIRAAAR